MRIRPESAGDSAAIAQLTARAFAEAPHASGQEAEIVAGLRRAGALTLSLVADSAGALVGHVAFSPVTIGTHRGAPWYGLGPVSVLPEGQGQGIGSALIRAGLEQLRQTGAGGCVVLGEPGYYSRFGFAVDDRLQLPGLPPEYFMCLRMSGEMPEGEVRYHAAFDGA